MRSRIFTITTELLDDLWCRDTPAFLPPGSKITGVHSDAPFDGLIVIRVDNSEFADIPEGAKLPHCEPIFETDEHGKPRFLRWNMT